MGWGGARSMFQPHIYSPTEYTQIPYVDNLIFVNILFYVIGKLCSDTLSYVITCINSAQSILLAFIGNMEDKYILNIKLR